MAGVYISYPFCAQKCTFCNFASDVYSGGARERYDAVLLEEVRRHEWGWRPETVYFGGGSPNLMSLGLLEKLMRLIPGERLSEVTLECSPGAVTQEAAEGWRDGGVNRVSLGVQSFVDEELRATGRRHTAEMVAGELAILRSVGLENVNIDLIAGLPGQTPDSWQQSLDWIERVGPPHVSVYIFETDEDSRLGSELLAGGTRYGAGRMPSDDWMAEFYEQAVDFLSRAGLERYEISNFARAGFASQHNLKYWRREPYVGFGLDAHSFDGRERKSNPDDLLSYLEGRGGLRGVMPDAEEEHFFVGLRLSEGIEPSAAEWERFAEPIARWMEAGLLERAGSRLRLSGEGVLVSNEILAEFVNA